MEPDAPGISVVILTQNSVRTLRRTLDSVREFDEVIVMDGGSVDGTEALARSYERVRFFFEPFPGWSAQRNNGLRHARHDWVLVVDSDEEVTSALREVLFRLVREPEPKLVYRMMRTEYFMGEVVEKGSGRGVYQARFFRRDRVHYEGELHEYPVIDGQKVSWKSDPRVGHLPEHARLLHDPDAAVAEHLRRLPTYAILRSKAWIQEGRRSSRRKLLRRFLRKFWKEYRATRSLGPRGFILSLLIALHYGLVELLVYEHTLLSGEGRSGAR
jgi:glycosyltransferase involved in cell wall biosynthesis